MKDHKQETEDLETAKTTFNISVSGGKKTLDIYFSVVLIFINTDVDTGVPVRRQFLHRLEGLSLLSVHFTAVSMHMKIQLL